MDSAGAAERQPKVIGNATEKGHGEHGNVFARNFTNSHENWWNSWPSLTHDQRIQFGLLDNREATVSKSHSWRSLTT